ncbi:hypothetical protein IQ62_38175 [Streptomyces scabiei]|nr:hypothetical protein IQ62_38175 [Streptomyces scabiei]
MDGTVNVLERLINGSTQMRRRHPGIPLAHLFQTEAVKTQLENVGDADPGPLYDGVTAGYSWF